MDKYELAAEALWLDARPDAQHACHNPRAVKLIARALRDAEANALEAAARLAIEVDTIGRPRWSHVQISDRLLAAAAGLRRGLDGLSG